MSTKKLFTLNRQLFDKETKEKIGDIESFHPTYDIEEIQARITHIRRQHYINCSNEQDVTKRGYDEINSRGNKSWSKDYIYSFTVYGNNHGVTYWIEYHELPLSTAVMHDNDLM